MKRSLLLLIIALAIGCGKISPPPDAKSVPMPDVAATKKDDATACAYWKCSTTKKLYMQKYMKSDSGQYRPAGAYKLDKGIGAFPLEDLAKYSSDSTFASVNDGFDPCPYCNNTSIGQCSCGKTLCLEGNRATCPWCGQPGDYSASRGWGVGGGG